MLNEPEISKVGQDYAVKAGRLLPLVKDTGKYNITYLYKNLHKNADKVTNRGEFNYPVLQHSFDGQNHSFSNSPEFSEQFNKYIPQLKTLYEMNLENQKPDGTRVTAPCVSLNKTHGDDETLNDYMKRKLPLDDIKGLRTPQINEEAIIPCQEFHCNKCSSCKPHQEEFVKSMQGILSHDANTGDGMRNFHVKNLLTTLNSWAAHQDERGHNDETVGDHKFDHDHYGHSLFSTALREMSNNLHRAYENDWIKSGGKGGGTHRDHLGQEYGKKTEAY